MYSTHYVTLCQQGISLCKYFLPSIDNCSNYTATDFFFWCVDIYAIYKSNSFYFIIIVNNTGPKNGELQYLNFSK